MPTVNFQPHLWLPTMDSGVHFWHGLQNLSGGPTKNGLGGGGGALLAWSPKFDWGSTKNGLGAHFWHGLQNLTGGPLLATKNGLGGHFWHGLQNLTGGPLLATKNGLGGALLVAKVLLGVQFWSPKKEWEVQKSTFSNQNRLVGKNGSLP